MQRFYNLQNNLSQPGRTSKTDFDFNSGQERQEIGINISDESCDKSQDLPGLRQYRNCP